MRDFGILKRMMRARCIEVMGWIGASFLVAGYAALSFGVLSSTDPLYQGLNALGAAGIVAISWHKRAYQPMMVNVMWLLVALMALAGLYLAS